MYVTAAAGSVSRIPLLHAMPCMHSLCVGVPLACVVELMCLRLALHCTALRWLRLRAAHWPGYALEMYGHRGASVS